MFPWIKRFAAGLLIAAVTTLPALAAPSAATTPSLVPLRLVAEAAGAHVDWNGATQVVTVTTADGQVATLSIGESTAVVDGQKVPVGATVVLANSRTMAPPQFIQELVGMPVEYDAATGRATVDPDFPTAIALVRAMPEGKTGQFAGRFTPALRGALSQQALASIAPSLARFGKLSRVAVVGEGENAVHKSVELAAQFERTPLRVVVRFSPEGPIDDWFMGPAAQAPGAPVPAYADPSAFTEESVVVGSAPWALPGTLTLPAGQGPFPAVVLIQGSGPNDRDESIGGVKPFRDLAQGLASRGIAVLRYEKRTFEHSQKFGALATFTLQQESVEDAIAAVQLVAGDQRIDPQQVYVLGHSLGATALARLFQQDSARQLRGGILMAGANDLFEALYQQNKHLVESGELPPLQLLFIESQIAMLRDPAFDPAKPPKGYMLGTPYYWHDLLPKTSVALSGQTRPLLILQGKRDIQVPAAQLESFRAELATHPDATYRLYEKLNHLFTEGEGELSSLKEYLVPANVAVYVIDDIAAWVKSR